MTNNGSQRRHGAAPAAAICLVLLAGALGCRKSPDPGLHTTRPKGGGRIHVRLKQPLEGLGEHREVWFNNVDLVLFTNTGVMKSLACETDRPACYDPAQPTEDSIAVAWEDMKRIEWSGGQLVTVLRTNGYRMNLFAPKPSGERRTMRVRYERIVPLGGGYEVRRTTKELTFDLANVEYVEFGVN